MLRIADAVHSPRAVTTAILGLGGVATYLINFPGSMEDDSFVQLLEGRNGSYNFWHPPIMSWMLGVSDMMPGPAAAWFVLFDMMLAFAALIGLLWATRRVSWAAVVCAAALLLLPQMLMLQAIVWKDALFADSCLAAFVCLALAGAYWSGRRIRIIALGTCAILLALAMLTRQNGLVVLPFAVVGLWIIAARQEKSSRTGAIYGVALLLGASGLGFGGNALLELRWDGTPAREQQIKILQLYDITGMVKREAQLPLPILNSNAPRLEHVIRDEGVRRWSPIKNDTLEVDPDIVAALDNTPARVIGAQWRALISQHPGLYLAVRAQLFHWVFQAPDVGQCHPFHVGDEGEAADLKELGMSPRLDARDLALWHYADFFEYTPAFWHAAYAAIALVVFVLVLRRRNPADLALASLIAAVFAFTSTFFVISIACDYRYLYVLDLTAIAGALYVAAERKDLLDPLWDRLVRR
jgi:hypothetical protein